MAKVNVARWRGHVEAAQAAGVTLSAYARAHGLSRHTLYAARQAMARADGEPALRGQRGARRHTGFVPAQVLPSAVMRRAQLPNGVVVTLEGVEAAILSGWWSSLAGWRCGG